MQRRPDVNRLGEVLWAVAAPSGLLACFCGRLLFLSMVMSDLFLGKPKRSTAIAACLDAMSCCMHPVAICASFTLRLDNVGPVVLR